LLKILSCYFLFSIKENKEYFSNKKKLKACLCMK